MTATVADTRLGPIFAGSLLIHAALLAIALVLPSGGGPSSTVPAYKVKIVEAPSIPQAHALNLEAPSLTNNAPPLPTAPAPDVTGLEAPRLPTSAPALPSAPAAPRVSALPTEPSPGKPLPAAPALPAPPSSTASRAASNPARTPSAIPAPPSLPSAPMPSEGPSLEERLRAKVKNLNLQVESAENPAPTEQSNPDAEKSIVSLRLFQNTVRERVKKNYTFPGTFPEDLRARVRVIIERSGKLRSAE